MNTKLTLLMVAMLGMALGAIAKEGDGAKEGAVKVVDAAAEGVSANEMEVLRKYYKWKKGEKLPTAYTLEELYKVMDDSADNTLELEDYDWQARKLVVALMVVGDKRFAKEMDGRAVPVQKEVATMLKPLWETYKLSYPKVQELAAVLKRLSEDE